MPLLSNSPSRIFGGRSGLAVPVPVLGAELLTNGNMEAGDPPSNWTSANTTLARETTNIRSGAAALKGTAAANNSNCNQQIVVAGNTWYFCDVWGAGAAGNLWRCNIYLPSGNATVGAQQGATAFTRYPQVVRTVAAETALQLQLRIVTSGHIAYWDDASVKPIALASMFSSRVYSTHATTKARCTVVPGTRAGVVCNLDSASAPANFVIASHDGTTARLTKCVAGTYTELVSAAAAYVAGAFVEIRRLAASDTWQLWYNGAKVGADQTISDAAIKSATLAGYFNTYAGNVLSEFSCVASA